ncbi:hypothetical protein NKH89_32870 [Mesorhizobium sp. M0923]|uniref:hypothetical protein n=1 Tax=Mesorhizobium sp. M0923 TaxID=2957028 RepID=UPI00333BE00B
MDTKEFRGFEKRADNVAWQDKSGPCRSTSEANSSGVQLLAVLGLAVLATIGFVGVMLKRPPVAAEKTTAASAVVEPLYDGGLVTEPARVDRAGEPDVTYMVQKVANEGAGIVNVIRSRNSGNTTATTSLSGVR